MSDNNSNESSDNKNEWLIKICNELLIEQIKNNAKEIEKAEKAEEVDKAEEVEDTVEIISDEINEKIRLLNLIIPDNEKLKYDKR